MRETIAEACKTIEDNQTAQALDGLLSLKAKSHDGVITLTSPALDTASATIVNNDNGASTSNISVVSTAPSTALAENASATLVDVAQHVIETTAQKRAIESEQQLQKSLEKARICNSEVLNVCKLAL